MYSVVLCWPHLRPYNTHELAFRYKKCVFLGYSPIHKGVKCLDVSIGRVYISRDVVFDESVYPFASLHPNGRALLKKELLLLPPHLQNIDHGGDNCTNSTDDPTSGTTSPCVQDHAAEIGAEIGAENDQNFEENELILHVPEEDGAGAEHEADPASPGTPVRQDSSDRARGSALDRALGRIRLRQSGIATSSPAGSASRLTRGSVKATAAETASPGSGSPPRMHP